MLGWDQSTWTAWSFQVAACILMCFQTGHYAFQSGLTESFSLGSHSNFSSRFNLVYMYYNFIEIVQLALYLALEQQGNHTLDAQQAEQVIDMAINCKNDRTLTMLQYEQCQNHSTRRMLTAGSATWAIQQACFIMIWSMFVVEWMCTILSTQHTQHGHWVRKTCRGIKIANYLNISSVTVVAVVALIVSPCHNGCITDTYRRTRFVLSLQNLLWMPLLTIVISVVVVVTLKKLWSMGIGASVRFTFAMALCVLTCAANAGYSLYLESKTFSFSSNYVWEFYTVFPHTTEEGKETTGLALGLWTVMSMLPLIILHHINTQERRHRLFKFNSLSTDLAGLFDPLLLSDHSQGFMGASKEAYVEEEGEVRRCTAVQQLEADPAAGLQHMTKPLRGVHKLEVGTHPLGHQLRQVYEIKIHECLKPAPYTFECSVAYLTFRLAEANDLFRAETNRWDRAINLMRNKSTQNRSQEGSGQSLGCAMSSLHEDAAYRDLASWRDKHEEAWRGYIRHVQDMLEANFGWCEMNSSSRIPGHFFKPSSSKKHYLLAATATNLQHYAINVSHSQDDIGPDCSFGITTVGAFAAHSLESKSLQHISQEHEEARQVIEDMSNSGNIAALNEMMKTEMKAASLKLQLEHRTTVAYSQALAAAVSTLVDAITMCFHKQQEDLVRLWFEIGYLFEMQSLLSTQGHEVDMLQDMRHAMMLLSRTSVIFNVYDPDQDDKGRNTEVDVSREKSGRIIVNVSLMKRTAQWVQEQQWDDHMTRNKGKCITFVPCLFTLGVNEMQTLANALPGIGCPELQAEINQLGLKDLEAYRAKFYNAETAVKPLEWLDVSEPFVVTQERERSQSSMESFRDRSASHGHDDRESVVNAEMNQMKKPDMWDDLRDLVGNSEPSEKDVQLLIDSFILCRAMHGGRATCCKSAKDRTSMASTLEMAVLMAAKGLFGREPYTREKLIGEVMCSLRGNQGVRLANCELNTGKKMVGPCAAYLTLTHMFS